MKCIKKYTQKKLNISDFRVFCGYLLKMGKKVKILNEQLDMVIYNVLSEDTVLLKEEVEKDLTETEVEKIAKRTFYDILKNARNTQLEKKVSEIVQDMVKKDTRFQKDIVEITKNVLVQLYKALWTKRSFWITDLKNNAS